MLQAAAALPSAAVRRAAAADDPSLQGAEGFFEFVVRLLALHSSRLEAAGARVLAVPHWREPGEHFVSGAAFLDTAYDPWKVPIDCS